MSHKKLLFFFLLFHFFLSRSYGVIPDTNGLRSDTINVLKYTLNLTMTDSTSGNAIIRFTPKMNNLKTLSLDLLQLHIDSIVMFNKQVSYTYNYTLIIINFPAIENIGDTTDVTVYYHGMPQRDKSGLGGFYHGSNYNFNLGVGWDAVPHNFGRVWFPCFDNFETRTQYEFNITSDTGYAAYCNGYLAKDTTNGGLRTRTWIMNDKIPSYLACAAVSQYTEIDETYKGKDTIPVIIAALPADTANVRKSFVHLFNAISIFQNLYGKYRWNKIGYSMLNEGGGWVIAMEHATNIGYPSVLADGSLNYEARPMAHELSHHWFGDLVTCSDAEQMWLNEGFAQYNQFAFVQYLYGDSAYHYNARTNHEYNLHYTYVLDHGYWAIGNVPQSWTYGSTTYNKGSDVVGTLRGYMGDSAFFKGLQYYLSTHEFQQVNSDTLMNSLQRYSGMNLSYFFNDWVFNPGFPHFSIDSMTSTPSGQNFLVSVYIRQRLTAAPAYYTNVPIEITFKSSSWASYSKTITVSAHVTTYTITLPFNPIFAALNLNEKLQAEAIAPDTLIINQPGRDSLTNSRFVINVKSVTDSAFLYVEHNYTAPDPVKDTALHYRISPNRFWKFSGIFPAGFSATAKLYYDGRKETNNNGGYLDTTLTLHTRDSIILLYRKSPAYDWTEFPAYSKHNIGANSNMYGYMSLDSVPPGEFAFANGISHVLGIEENKASHITMNVFPNPASETVNATFNNTLPDESIYIFDIQGNIITRYFITDSQQSIKFNSAGWNSGIYIISLRLKNKILASQKVIIIH